jgi:hypothetical protein
MLRFFQHPTPGLPKMVAKVPHVLYITPISYFSAYIRLNVNLI